MDMTNKRIYYTGDLKDKNRKIARIKLDSYIDDVESLSAEELSEYLRNLNDKYKGWFDKISIHVCLPNYDELDISTGMYFLGERLETDEEYEQRMIENNG